MLAALHALIYSDDPDATRAFFRDVLQLPNLNADFGANWLIFKTGPSELGVHPTQGDHEGHSFSHPRHHSISLVFDDIDTAMSELTARGAVYQGEPQDWGFGRCVMLEVPGADPILAYEPKHPKAYEL